MSLFIGTIPILGPSCKAGGGKGFVGSAAARQTGADGGGSFRHRRQEVLQSVSSICPWLHFPQSVHHFLLRRSSLCLAALPRAPTWNSHQDCPEECAGWALAGRWAGSISLASTALQKPSEEHSGRSLG